MLSSAVHGASRDAAARLMRLARARIAARSGTPASRTPVTEQDWSQVTHTAAALQSAGMACAHRARSD